MYQPPLHDLNTPADCKLGAQGYHEMQHNPTHAYVIASYRELERIVLKQYIELREGGFQFEFVEHDPYRDSDTMLWDARHGGIKVFADHGATLPDDHPMKREVTTSHVLNDIFRAVHDVMGHVVANSGFGPLGEYRAWLAHRRTMTPLALNALWCETRGQNLWTNYYSDHETMPLKERPYATQKAGLAPRTNW